MKLIPHRLTGNVFTGYSEFDSIWYRSRSPHRISALPPAYNANRYASTYFGENQLAPGSIGISPLTTPHPPTFQRWSVRTSTWCYPSFILDMVRSPGFGSINTDITPYSDSVSLWLRHSRLNLPVPISRRLILQQARHHSFNRALTACKLTVSCSISLPSRGSFHLSLAVLFTIGHAGVFSLTRWSSRIHTGFHVPRATRDPARLLKFSTTGLSPSLVQFSAASSNLHSPRCRPTTPAVKTAGLGSSRFARRYSGNRVFFLFLRLLRCFSSPGALVSSYGFR